MTSGKAAKERPDPKRGRGGNCGCGFEWKGETQTRQTDRRGRGEVGLIGKGLDSVQCG